MLIFLAAPTYFFLNPYQYKFRTALNLFFLNPHQHKFRTLFASSVSQKEDRADTYAAEHVYTVIGVQKVRWGSQVIQYFKDEFRPAARGDVKLKSKDRGDVKLKSKDIK